MFHHKWWIRLSLALLILGASLSSAYWVTTLSAMGGDLCFATSNDGATVFSSMDATAVQQATSSAQSGDTVKISGECVGTQVRAGETQSVYISKTVTLTGGYLTSDWSTPVVTGTAILDADFGGRVIYITDGITVTLNQLTVRHGSVSNVAGGGIYVGGTSVNQTTLNLNHVTIEDNETTGFFGNGGGLYATAHELNLQYVTIRNNSSAENGGGLHINPPGSKLNLVNSAIYSNTAASLGGGMTLAGILNMVNTTLSHNSAQQGGAMYNTNGAFISSSTIVSNSASSVTGGIHAASYIHVRNSIIADNAGGNCGGSVIASGGYNMSDTSCSGLSGATNDLVNTDPELRPLNTANNYIPYHYPYSTSPVLDAGQTPACTVAISPFASSPFYNDGDILALDQRDLPRLDADGDMIAQCDIGAVEYAGEEENLCTFEEGFVVDADISIHTNDVVVMVNNLGSFTLNRTAQPYGGDVVEVVTTSGNYTHTDSLLDVTNHFYQATPTCDASGQTVDPSQWMGKFTFVLEPGS